MTIIMTMIMVNIHEAKARLSEFVEAASRGERVMICNRNRPVAELRPVAQPSVERRLGTAAGSVTIRPSFFEPLPDDELDAFEGRTGERPSTSRVAEKKGNSQVPRGRRR
jgi:prevent-host-death family protein